MIRLSRVYFPPLMAQRMDQARERAAQMLALADLTLADWEKEEMAACAPSRWQVRAADASPIDIDESRAGGALVESGQVAQMIEGPAGDRGVVRGCEIFG